MFEIDIVVQIPPIREYCIRVKVKSIEKAVPNLRSAYHV